MFEHHASYVIMELSRRVYQNVLIGNDVEAIRLSNLNNLIECEFRDAAKEVQERYPTTGKES